MSYAAILLGVSVSVAAAAGAQIAPPTAPAQRTCPVEKYAKTVGDGVHLDTAAIQKAIDDCAAKGGGVVQLHGAPMFVSGPLQLKSHITLDIAAGTTLAGSENHEDYPETTLLNEPARRGLLWARDATDLTIRGGGTIDGRGESWWINPHQPRPRMIFFENVKHLLMENVTVQNSPMWQITLYRSEDLTFRNMKILAPTPAGHNTDGIDPFSSKHVLIDHVFIDTGDDNVAIKSGQPKSEGPNEPTVDVTIRDCTFLHGHGLSVGSEVAGGVQQVRAERVTFKGTTQGIRIKSGRDRGNDIGGFVYKDITMEDVGTAIQITDYYGGPKGGAAVVEPAPVTRLTPHMHDITLQNVNVISAKNGVEIEGLPEAPVKNIRFDGVTIHAQKAGRIAYAEFASDQVEITAADGQPPVVGKGVVGIK